MATQQTRQWGKTPPFSVNRPSDKELAENDAMLAELKLQNSWEPIERTRLRYARIEGSPGSADIAK